MNQGINFYKTYDVIKISQCHESNGAKTLTPNSRLDRWNAVHDAITSWLINDANDDVSVKVAEERFQFHDPLQKKIMSELFERFRKLLPKPLPEVNIDYFRKEVTKEINNSEVGMYTSFQYELTDNDNIEYIKLKAGVTEIEDIDKAIIAESKYDDETFYTAQLIKDDFAEIEEPSNSKEIIEEYFKIIEEYETNRKKTEPGLHCYMCERPSRCGQYPVVNGEEVKSRDRGILISKTNLLNLENCERWASWRAQYAIPKDFENDSDESRLGRKYHDFAQKMLVNNNDIFGSDEPKRLEALLENEEEKFKTQILKKYKELIEELDKNISDKDNLEIKLAEYGLGFTITENGIVANKNMSLRDGKVAVTFMGQADLVGRYDDKPLIIELKTGRESQNDLTEAELYALGAKLLLNEDEVTVFHIYTNQDGGKLKPRVFGKDDYDTIIQKFQNKAQRIAKWNPADAMSPKFTVGDWCSNCDYQITCPEYR
mgnify:FL=1